MDPLGKITHWWDKLILAFPMDIPDEYQEIENQCAVIIRSRRPTTAQFRKPQIIRELLDQFGPYITHRHISYVPPNFIIYLSSAQVQFNIISQGILHTTEFELDVLPWSKEHELAQLPWIPETARTVCEIVIDPLKILPVISNHANYIGICILKDNYVAMMPSSYDLKAPDFSYLVIAELKDYYYNKHTHLSSCKDIVNQIASLFQHHISHITRQIAVIYNGIQMIQNYSMQNRQDDVFSYADELHSITTNVLINATNIDELLIMINGQHNSMLNLDAFKKIPSLLEVPVPETYVKRLKVIHAVATKQVYGSEAIITTTETTEGKYEAFLTIGKVTRKFNEIPLPTPATIEAIVIYQSLRYITNVLGYKIVDLNYPTLSSLISAINKQTTQMSLLQCCASDIQEYTEQLYDHFTGLQHNSAATLNNCDKISHLKQGIQQLCIIIQDFYNDILKSCNAFTDAKIQYFSEHITTEKPTMKVPRWIELQMPDGTYAPPPQRSL